eukprot:gene1802-2425_t
MVSLSRPIFRMATVAALAVTVSLAPALAAAQSLIREQVEMGVAVRMAVLDALAQHLPNLAKGALSGALIERFRRERQTLARLAHPNIARLFDGGETDIGEPYIVMELVEGRPLADWRGAETPSHCARLDLFLAAASAVTFAHQNLIVHGDITLANILVDAAGLTKLIDLGISSASIATPLPMPL